MTSKTIGFRPTNEERKIIENCMKKEGLKKDAEAVRYILKDYSNLKIQSEQSSSSSSTFSQKDLDKASRIAEILAIYPMRIPCPRDNQFYLTETLIAMCKECKPRIRKECMVHKVPNF